MIVLRVLLNGFIMAAEVAAIMGAAALGYFYPNAFAALTALVTLLLGLRLESARLQNELPFYFGTIPRGTILVALIGCGEAIVKSILAGVVALLTFSGTDSSRLFWIAVVFSLCLYAGTNILRFISGSLAAKPARWGYFRLAAPLGLLFSAGLALLVAVSVIPKAGIADIGRKLIFETAAKASVGEASELLFLVKQYFDDLIVTLLSALMPLEWARIAGILVSVNVLTGFVIAIYAVVIAQAVRWFEQRLP